MGLFKDIYYFISRLTLVDIVFFTASILLVILVVTLIYFIKINKSVFKDEDDDILPPMNTKKKEDNLENIVENITENLKEEKEEYNDEEAPLIDLNTLTKRLEQEESERVDVSEYERDQEEKAIISYDELINKHKNYGINYEEEKVMDDVVVKKINLKDLVNQNIEEYKISDDLKVVSYEKEEAFLSALKELNHLLN